MRLLGFYENVGVVVWFSRLQSGSVKVVKGWKGKRHEHYMQLCRKGTPDIMVVLNDGSTIWMELKTKTGKLRPEQEEFRSLFTGLDNHYCMVVREADEVEEVLTKYKEFDKEIKEVFPNGNHS
jgi:hypothetical protein